MASQKFEARHQARVDAYNAAWGPFRENTSNRLSHLEEMEKGREKNRAQNKLYIDVISDIALSLPIRPTRLGTRVRSFIPDEVIDFIITPQIKLMNAEPQARGLILGLQRKIKAEKILQP